ncbi:MAG: hypothetical protein CFE44_02605 [Burkholderiales bacterium PBB4]|nr:MAG: hypothetical protein CFE44_02605 [Burkholderiales bacterium PBB4]
MTRLLLLIILVSSVVARAEVALWNGNKLTAAQPFPGRVLAVESSWAGYRLLIESIGEGDKTYCIAQVWPGGLPRLDYKVIKKEDFPKPSVATVYLNPSIAVDGFSWSMGAHKIGRIFGDDDSLKKVVIEESDTNNRQGEKAAPSSGDKPSK